MKSMNSIILVILISAGAVCLAMAVNELPELWSLIMSWLRPPYLHVVMNGIIIAIAAASRFCRNHPAPPVRPKHLISATTPPPAYYAAYSSPPEVTALVEKAAMYDSEDGDVVELKAVMVNGRELVAEDEGEIALADRTFTYDTPSPERSTPEFQLEYYPAANVTGNVAEIINDSTWKTTREGPSRAALEVFRHGGAPREVPDRIRYSTRKSKSFKERTIHDDSPPSHASSGILIKASPSRRNKLKRRVDAEDVSVDRSLTYYTRSPERYSPEILLPGNDPIKTIPQRVMEPPTKTTEEVYETLESAWKKITEGASHAAAAAQEEARYVGAAPQPSLKSSSFQERVLYCNDSPASSVIQKELSPSQDELNHRVEAFIKKVNDEIRLRRQKSSTNQYIQLNSAA